MPHYLQQEWLTKQLRNSEAAGLDDSCLSAFIDQNGNLPPVLPPVQELATSILANVGLACAPRLAFVIGDWIIKHIAGQLRLGARRRLPICWQWRLALNLLLAFLAKLPQ